ncbi:XRE family transcriptional regulator [Streptomyces sp. G44]|uniref:helix-turn-helix domain-containing protein n=1 Tax=Streptomyces sp. G44 TaxID=2807632 RepID=UPI0019605209|nr:XRE family transcriptional regulator [Streptomyces sp. G44]MBM7169289.1 XRE family transcriptional regulator [Streptomyces sp. G44]
MPRWKALPEELDPEVREFADRLRALVDHSGLSVAAVSDRTGYSKTSWERYLNGRLLAPKGAVVALAEVTGTQPVHLITLWELAERAWSRSEMRHDMTMQAIRISQARAALGELGGGSGGRGGSGDPRGSRGSDAAGAGVGSSAGAGAGVDTGAGAGGAEKGGRSARGGFGGLTGVAGPAGVSPTVPPSVSSSSYGDASASPFGAAGAGAGGGSPDGQRRRRKVTMFLAGVVGALVVIAVAVFLPGLRGGGEGGGDGARSPVAPSRTGEAELPDGVECRGADCAGKDPESMGCGGELARTASRATVGGALIEVRYSKACGAAWARITRASPGDEVRVTGAGGGGAAAQKGTVDEDFDAYTPMVAVKAGGAAKACAVLVSGATGCTE